MDETQMTYGRSLASITGDYNAPLKVRTDRSIDYGRRRSGQSAPREGPKDGLNNTVNIPEASGGIVTLGHDSWFGIQIASFGCYVRQRS
jgi:hypothetical protein